jgi:transposase
MRQKSTTTTSPSERDVRNIRRVTRKQYSAEEKFRVVLDGLRGESSIAELCRREGISRGFITAGRRSSSKPANAGWSGDTARSATSSEVTDLRREARALKEVVAEQALATYTKAGQGRDRSRSAFAGVYDVWKGDGGRAIASFAIVRPTPRRAQRSIMTACLSCSMTRSLTNGCAAHPIRLQR